MEELEKDKTYTFKEEDDDNDEDYNKFKFNNSGNKVIKRKAIRQKKKKQLVRIKNKLFKGDAICNEDYEADI